MALSSEDLRDRADTAQPRASSKHGYFSDGYVAGWEAARREAEAPCGTCGDDPMVCADVPGLRHCEKATREGPGSADAATCLAGPNAGRGGHEWTGSGVNGTFCRHCGIKRADAKPAPAADDLLDRLDAANKSGLSLGALWNLCGEAAERIEAQAREIARLEQYHVGGALKKISDIEAERDALKARVAELNAEVKDATAQYLAVSHKHGKLVDRVARLIHILRQVEKFKPDSDVLPYRQIFGTTKLSTMCSSGVLSFWKAALRSIPNALLRFGKP